MLSSHPGTCYLCKEKCRYYPRIEGIGDHVKVQGHPLVSWKHQYHRRPNPRPLPFGLPVSGHTLRKPATQPQCRERARECTSRPAESEKEKDQDGQVPGADGIPSKYGEPEGFSWKQKREKIVSVYVVGCRFLLEMPTNNAPTSLPQSLSTLVEWEDL